MNGSIDRLEPEIERGYLRHQIDRDAGVLGKKTRKPWREPACAECRQNSQIKRSPEGICPEIQRGRTNLEERIANFARISLPAHRQPDRLLLAVEQLDTKLLLQCADLTTDSTLGEAEFLGRRSHTSRAGRRFESGEPRQRR